MFERILIANRGEIACRIMRTCRRLGIETIAVYSSADRDARHVREADRAVAIGGAAAAESYLDTGRILEAARETGAQAIHPGYGFVSENAGFARACEKAGIVFIGPRAETIDRMGSKAEAKALMESAGVPVVPGYHDADQGDDKLAAEADRIGYPMMLKPAAGGGGKGMRIVRRAGDFAGHLESARREAKNAFGDERMILERYVESPRHIEFQIFGDEHGHVIHLNERECSVQRRYQKIIEETPSPFLNAERRQAMGQAAVDAAAAVSYRGAGTVEFIVGVDGAFYFMEMNTRLQVEHPVTEEVTGQDLVEWQLRVARGEPLPLAQDEVRSTGHAIEARIYAESPEKGFLPDSGTLTRLVLPPTGRHVRIDAGVAEGDAVSVHYDPMIAKLIVFDETRDRALTRLQHALEQSYIAGLDTNLAFLIRLAHHETLRAAEFDTGFLDRELESVLPEDARPAGKVFVAVAVHHLLAREARGNPVPGDPYSPWGLADAWQPGIPARQALALDAGGGEPVEIACTGAAGRYRLALGEAVHAVEQARLTRRGVDYTLDGHQIRLRLAAMPDGYRVNADNARWHVSIIDPLAGAGAGPADERHVTAPMPGRVIALKVAEGEAVSEGQELVVIEAMKMEISLQAPHDGTVAAIRHGEGDFVEADTALVEVE